MFLTIVKSRINARIRRNSNRIFILYKDHIFVEVGFVRIILGGTGCAGAATRLCPPIMQSVRID